MTLSIIVKSIEIERDYSLLLSILSVFPLGLFFLKKKLNKSKIDPIRLATEKMAIARPDNPRGR